MYDCFIKWLAVFQLYWATIEEISEGAMDTKLIGIVACKIYNIKLKHIMHNFYLFSHIKIRRRYLVGSIKICSKFP